ncbi:MAG: MFS transporter [Sandaracinaceae bacterium]|nr:MFS transporter [Sandaracinaceae bacterium]
MIWTAIAISASLLQTGVPWQFFAVGGVVGLVQGGTQSLSRSLYASMIPEAASAEMFAFYSLFSKLSAIGGPLLFALVAEGTGVQSRRHPRDERVLRDRRPHAGPGRRAQGACAARPLGS